MMLMLWSCSGIGFNSGDLIGKDRMANILYDIALAEAFVETYQLKDSTLNKDSALQKEIDLVALQKEIDLVLKYHGIEPKLFSKSYQFYQQHPQDFKVLIDTANARAIRNRENSYSQRKPNPS
ncbi:MAG: DUF4296 domain-containing protein [Chitinophagaceae bacterium]|nr:DUF4296 domain-containing protein [Chitinophagaceae bacterium]